MKTALLLVSLWSTPTAIVVPDGGMSANAVAAATAVCVDAGVVAGPALRSCTSAVLGGAAACVVGSALALGTLACGAAISAIVDSCTCVDMDDFVAYLWDTASWSGCTSVGIMNCGGPPRASDYMCLDSPSGSSGGGNSGSGSGSGGGGDDECESGYYASSGACCDEAYYVGDVLICEVNN